MIKTAILLSVKSLGLTGEIIHEICTTFHRYHTLKIHNPKFVDYNDQQFGHKEIKDRRHLKCNPCELHVYKTDGLQGTKKYLYS